jgi:hypothetical protein
MVAATVPRRADDFCGLIQLEPTEIEERGDDLSAPSIS